MSKQIALILSIMIAGCNKPVPSVPSITSKPAQSNANDDLPSDKDTIFETDWERIKNDYRFDNGNFAKNWEGRRVKIAAILMKSHIGDFMVIPGVDAEPMIYGAASPNSPGKSPANGDIVVITGRVSPSCFLPAEKVERAPEAKIRMF